MDSMALITPQQRMGPPLRSFAPMRMTASWFGSLDPPNTRLWRDRSALERGLPLIVSC